MFNMEYDLEEIGRRIRDERKKLNLSQDGLINELASRAIYIGRNTLSSIENGNLNGCKFDFVIALCELFHCDVGFLLGEYSARDYKTEDISKYTGLSTVSVEKIRSNGHVAEALNYILETRQSEDFTRIYLSCINAIYITHTRQYMDELVQKHHLRKDKKGSEKGNEIFENSEKFALWNTLNEIIDNVDSTETFQRIMTNRKMKMIDRLKYYDSGAKGEEHNYEFDPQ